MGSAQELAFFFSDIADSTRLWEQHSDLMAEALALHDDIAIGAIEAAGGSAFKHTGDGMAATFERCEDAVLAGVAMQLAFAAAPWPDPVQIAVRVGIHHGAFQARANDFFGRSVNWAARIMTAAEAGQVLVSERVRHLLPPTFEFAFRDEGSHALKGVSEPVRLHSVEAAGLVNGLSAPAAAETQQSLPVALTDLIGRQADVKAVVDSLSERRVVTILGPPGTGKTRLAVEVADRVSGHWNQGVHVIELASVVGEAGVADAVASTIANEVLGPEPLADSGTGLQRLVSAEIGERLLVLDNCEHVLDAVVEVVEALFATVPALGILATSRERLGVSSEAVIELEPLACAGSEADMAPAVQLFVQRARQAGARLGVDDLRTVQQICERLDGVPLAIELAAARLNVLSVNDLNDRLFELLGTRRRRDRRSERHRTITDAVEWSWGLLDEEERLVLCRAAVFVDSFDLDAATAVCGADDFDVFEVMDVLGSLRDRSFLSQVYAESGNRFRLLEIIRSFAVDKHDAEDRTATQLRHQQYFVGHATEHMHALDDKPAPSLMAQLALDDRNYTAAVTFAGGEGLHHARILAVRLQTYWRESGRMPAGYTLTRALVDPPDESSRVWQALVGSTVTAAVMVGEVAEVREFRVRLAELADGDLHPAGIPSYFALGFCGIAEARFSEAAFWFERAAEAAGGIDGATVRQALMIAGACHCYAQDPSAALPIYATAASVPPPEQAWFAKYHAVFDASAQLQADPSRADSSQLVAVIDEALDELAGLALGFRLVIAIHQAAFGLVAVDAFEPLDRWWPVALATARRSGYRWGVGLSVEVGGWSAAHHGDDQAAIDRWAVANALFADGGFSFGESHRAVGAEWRQTVMDRSPQLRAAAVAGADLGRFVDAMIAVEQVRA